MHYSNTKITFSLLCPLTFPLPSILHRSLSLSSSSQHSHPPSSSSLSLSVSCKTKNINLQKRGFCGVLAEIGKAIEVHKSQSPMGFTMDLNLLLLVAMVATNMLSLNHLFSTLQTSKRPPSPAPIPDPPPLYQISSYTATLPSFPHQHCLPQPPGPSSIGT
jgi:hypothetical protein